MFSLAFASRHAPRHVSCQLSLATCRMPLPLPAVAVAAIAACLWLIGTTGLRSNCHHRRFVSVMVFRPVILLPHARPVPHPVLRPVTAALWPRSPHIRSWSWPIRMVIMILVMQHQTLTMSLQEWALVPPWAAQRRRIVRCPAAPPFSAPVSAVAATPPRTRQSAASQRSGNPHNTISIYHYQISSLSVCHGSTTCCPNPYQELTNFLSVCLFSGPALAAAAASPWSHCPLCATACRRPWLWHATTPRYRPHRKRPRARIRKTRRRQGELRQLGCQQITLAYYWPRSANKGQEHWAMSHEPMCHGARGVNIRQASGYSGGYHSCLLLHNSHLTHARNLFSFGLLLLFSLSNPRCMQHGMQFAMATHYPGADCVRAVGVDSRYTRCTRPPKRNVRNRQPKRNARPPKHWP